MVAALKDGDTKELPQEVKNWVSSHKQDYDESFATSALISLNYCKIIEFSELAQLWSEVEEGLWIENVSNIEARLK